jgi:hypothetical protein
VRPPGDEGLLRARAILSDNARVVHATGGSFDLGSAESLLDAVVGDITRHPMREDQLIATLKRWPLADVVATLAELESSDQVASLERYGVRFWAASPAYYPDE